MDGHNPKASVSLGRIFGIHVRLHASVLIIVALILVSLAEGAFTLWHPDWPWWTAWSTALAATLLFLASLLTARARSLRGGAQARHRGAADHAVRVRWRGRDLRRTGRSPQRAADRDRWTADEHRYRARRSHSSPRCWYRPTSLRARQPIRSLRWCRCRRSRRSAYGLRR